MHSIEKIRQHTKLCRILILILLISQNEGFGQYGMEVSPRLSPSKGLYQKIGFTEIEIRYGSPSVKGRKVWGELVPFNKVWRAGANNATTIAFSETVEINGQTLTAGKYGLFMIPKEKDRWEIIFNKVHDQWGAFRYDEAEDILRVQGLPIRSNFNDELTYSLESNSPEFGMIFLNWNRFKIGFEVKTNHLELVKKQVVKSYEKADNLLKWVSYLEGADYLIKQNSNSALAMEWINQSEKEVMNLKEEWNHNYMPKEYMMGHMYWLKAVLLAQKDDINGALKCTDKMKAFKGGYLFYPTQKESLKIDEQIAAWQKAKS